MDSSVRKNGAHSTENVQLNRAGDQRNRDDVSGGMERHVHGGTWKDDVAGGFLRVLQGRIIHTAHLRLTTRP